MSAEDAARRFAAERPPIRRGAAFDRPPREEEYDDAPAPAMVRRRRVEYAPEPVRKSGFVTFLEGLFLIVLILSVGGFALWAIADRTAAVAPQQALPTAGIAPRPTYPPAPTSDYGIAAYNAAQEPPAPVDTPARGIAPQEGAQAVVEDVPTALPEPSEPTFKDSFQESTCSAMITYLRGHRCFGRTGQAPLPAVGDSSFAASFK